MGKELGWEEGGRNLIPIFPTWLGVVVVTMVYSYAFLLSFPVVFHSVPTSLYPPEDCFDLVTSPYWWFCSCFMITARGWGSAPDL